MIVSTLPDPETHEAWKDIEALLRAATADGVEAYQPEYDVLWVAIEDATLWGCATTRLKIDGTEAELLCVAGRWFREWIGPMEAEMCAWGRLCGARRFVSRGRKGWVRFARTFGWVASGHDNGKALFSKEL